MAKKASKKKTATKKVAVVKEEKQTPSEESAPTAKVIKNHNMTRMLAALKSTVTLNEMRCALEIMIKAGGLHLLVLLFRSLKMNEQHLDCSKTKTLFPLFPL